MSQPQQMALPDSVLASGAISSPLWVQWVEQEVGLFLLIGGAILLALRLGYAGHKLWTDIRDRNKPKD